MEYNLSICQKAIADNFPSLDIKDAAIIDFSSRFSKSTKIQKKIIGQMIYYWFDYGKIATENPLLKLNSEAIRKRIRHLCELKIFEAHPLNRGGKVFFAFGEGFEKTHKYDEKGREENPDLSADTRKRSGRKSLPRREENPDLSEKGREENPDNHNNQFNHKKTDQEEQERDAQNALAPPFAHVGTIQIPETNIPLEAEKKENDFTGAGPGAEFIVTTITPQAPYIRLVEKVEIQEQPGPKTPTVTPGRRSQAAPTIHPENLQAFDHFSDPEKCRALWSEWIEYKWGQHRDKYKTPQSELVMLRKLYTWSHGQAEMVSQIIEKSVGNLYKGLIDPNEKKGNGTEKRLDLNPAQRQHLTLAQYVAQRRINAENRDAME